MLAATVVIAVPAILNTLNVPWLLCNEQLNEASLPAAMNVRCKHVRLFICFNQFNVPTMICTIVIDNRKHADGESAAIVDDHCISSRNDEVDHNEEKAAN